MTDPLRHRYIDCEDARMPFCVGQTLSETTCRACLLRLHAAVAERLAELDNEAKGGTR